MSTDAASAVDTLLAPLPDACKDLRLNISTMLRGSGVDQPTTYCSAIAVAYFVVQSFGRSAASRFGVAAFGGRNDGRRGGRLADGYDHGLLQIAQLLGKPTYGQMRPSLRMNRMMSPAIRN